MPVFDLKSLTERVKTFAESLRVGGCPGRFLPCREGVTPQGDELVLGFSCFALKTFYTLGLWDGLSSEEQNEWIKLIRSFQTETAHGRGAIGRGAFLDPAVMSYLEGARTWRGRLREPFWRRLGPTPLQRVIHAETKQAIATLAEVAASPHRAYLGFPRTPEAATRYLGRFDWTKPWASGAHFAVLCVFAMTQSPEDSREALRDSLATFIASMAALSTGGYYSDECPAHGELINGAMKVLTGLDWLGAPIHYPERLIDTCLGVSPEAEGCHLVDAVYVLHRCAASTHHRRSEIISFCRKIIEMIGRHFVPEEGGFSYYVGASQRSYYGVPISEGRPVADLHGTSLLVWALAMILELTGENTQNWRVIKP